MSHLLLNEKQTNKQTNQPTNKQIAHHLSTLVVPIHFIIPFIRNDEGCVRLLYFGIRIHESLFLQISSVVIFWSLERYLIKAGF